MLKIAEFLSAGCTVKILLADIHGFLDNLKAPIELVKYRAEYYKYVITNLLQAVGVSTDKLEFVLGSTYQLTPGYQMDLLRLCTIVTEHDAKKAGSEVVKQVDNATLSGLIYPLMQALDEQYLGVDAQFGGVDQRKIFALAKDVLPRIGYKERAHFMNSMVPGLAGGKMSASDPNSKIDVLDDAETVTAKLKKAVAAPKVVEENGLLSFVEYVLLPASALKTGKQHFVVERLDKKGEEREPKLEYNSIAEMHADYREDIVCHDLLNLLRLNSPSANILSLQLWPQDLKAAIVKSLNILLGSVQAAFKASEEWQRIEKLAYPPPPAPEKKKKEKKKDKGTRAPGAAKVEAQPDGSIEGDEKDKDEVNLAGSATEAIKELELEKKAI